MRKSCIGYQCAVVAAVAGLASGASLAQPFNVAIVAAASAGCNFTDPQAKLQGSGLFNIVDVIDVALGTPSLATLQQYDAVICWTNSTPQDTNAWGDVLADYVDAGGGVVVAVFANSTVTANRDIGGRWRNNPAYEVIVPRTGNISTASGLGTIHDPSHPIMAGVSNFTCSTCFRMNGTGLHPGATLIASWADGRPLVVVGSNPKRVDIGFYPPSSDCVAAYWSPAGHGDEMMAQAVAFAAGGGGGCYADCDTSTGVGVLDIFDFLCFGNRFAANDPYACDCDTTTGPGVCDIFDFLCFGNEFNAGC